MDRFCVRGCTRRGHHWAACPDYAREDGGCRGCVQEDARAGGVICERCFQRMRFLLGEIPDLLGRLRSLADPSKAKPTDQERVGSQPSESFPPVADDLLDAIAAVENANEYFYAWGCGLEDLQNDAEVVAALGGMLLDRHPPADGVRDAWSVQDAVDRWGVERRDRTRVAWVDDGEDREVASFAKPEWRDPIIGRKEAERIAGSPSTLRRWVTIGELDKVGEIWIAGARTVLYRRAEVEATRDRMGARRVTQKGRGKR